MTYRSSRLRRASLVVAGASALVLVCAGCLREPGAAGGNGKDDSVVEIMYGFTDAASDQFKAEIDAFADANDIEVKYSPTPDFNSLIATRVAGRDAPDIALFPQPGLMAGFQQDLVPLTDMVAAADLDAMVPGIVEAGKIEGEQYAMPMSLNVKSIVFYPRKSFEAAGLTVPDTLDGLVDMTDSIARSGTAPWCFGIESAAATGWPATDWMENLILIENGPRVYDRWVNHEIAFDSEPVVAAADTMTELLLTKGHTYGGRQAVASNNFATAATPMFDDPPGCYMHRQGNFIARDGGFPEAVLKDIDDVVGVFPMPGETAADKPVLGAGDLASVFNETPDVEKVMGHMASKDFGADWAKANGFISPRTDFDTSNYPNETAKQMATIAYDSTAFVFDGSDQMPGEVGSGSFWRDMTAWISGQQSEREALDNIEASWPTSTG